MNRTALCLVSIGLLLAAGMAPSSAERATTAQLAAQPRIIVHPRSSYPGPNARRYCRSWLAKEYRVSGTVIVPRMQCWWQ